MRLCVFEDSAVSNFYPLTYLRPVFELRCGHTRLFEKVQQTYPDAQVTYMVRDYLRDVTDERFGGSANNIDDLGDDTLFVNGRYLDFGEYDFSGTEEEAGVCDNGIVYVRAKKKTICKYKNLPPDEIVERLACELPQKTLDIKLLSYPWDLVNDNAAAIRNDFKRLGKSGVHRDLHPMSCVYGSEDQVYVAASATIQPFVTIDTQSGPVIIDEDVVVSSHTMIQGPACVGKGTRLLGGKIREGTSIGPVCRIGGEVEESIIHGYSNKYHDGFLGHSYICEWVNIGALTSNSDLKNDYSTVQIYTNGVLVETGYTKVGSFIGDHTKLSIGCLLNTGSTIGIMDNLVAHGPLFPKFLTSFVWVINGKPLKGSGIVSMLQMAEMVMGRRGVVMSEAEKELIKQVFRMTNAERRESIKRARKLN